MKVGVLGGTFDPVHNAHTHLARSVRETLKLDRILFMVSGRPPHKTKMPLTSAFHRFAMVALQTLPERDFFASALELDPTRPPYTIQTLRHLYEISPSDEFCFIAGSDSLRELHLWKDYDRLLEGFSLIFVQRSGNEVNLNTSDIQNTVKPFIELLERGESFEIRQGRSILIDVAAPDISSSDIRRALAEGREPPPGSLSAPVSGYIRKYRLYEAQDRTETNL